MRRFTDGYALWLGLSAVINCSPIPAQSVGDDWAGPAGTATEVWRDDFDGPADAAPDSSKWTAEVRPHGDNGELDYDTDRPQNAALDGEGHLKIRAIAEHYVDVTGRASLQPYTSARLDTRGKMEQAFGRFEARIKLPAGGRGVWPAFWILGTNCDVEPWPTCGEVDIMEMRGSRPSEVSGSLHGPAYSGDSAYTRSFELSDGTFGDAYHTFTLEWAADGMRWLVDGEVFHVRTREGVESLQKRWVFDHPVYVIVNLAIGGLFDGAPDSSVTFPQEMLIDYVSVSRFD